MATVFFVDTNFFLQLKDIAELRWSDISGDREILILVPRAVQREIDRLKQDGNSRRSKRARKASSFLREVIQSVDLTRIVSEPNPRVLLSFPPPTDPSHPRPPTLDGFSADDEIVGEVLNYAAARPSEDVALLTNDTGPMLTARYHNLKYTEVPDSWLLEPEPDVRDKSIQDLKRRVEGLEKQHPVIEISAWAEDRKITSMEVTIPSFESLSEDATRQIIEVIVERCPRAERFGSSGMELLHQRTIALGGGLAGSYQPPTKDEIEAYRNVNYPEWLNRVREFLAELPRRLNEPPLSTAIQFRLQNTGTVPAINAVFEINGAGPVLIQAPEKKCSEKPDASTDLKLPRPPKPPAGRFLGADMGLKSYLESVIRPDRFDTQARLTETFLEHPSAFRERDRHAFYWVVRRPDPTESLSLNCDEFRHQEDPEHFDISVVLPRNATTNGVVTCKLSATNLPKPSKIDIPVKIVSEKADTEKYARQLVLELPRAIRWE